MIPLSHFHFHQRREMRSPSNVIITGIAVADLLVMVEYIPNTVIHHILYFQECPITDLKRYDTFLISAHYIFHIAYYFSMRDVSTMLHLVLAYWRYQSIR